MQSDTSQPAAGGHNARFATTRWSIVLAAGDRRSPDGDCALQALCRTYWYPLYAYARRRGHSAEEAADVTQEFFSRLLEKNFLQSADRSRGRFRSFLLTVFKRFLSSERDKQQALKRGGGLQHFSIDLQAGERQYSCEPSHDWTPEKLYERRWAMTLLQNVLSSLEREYRSKGQNRLFEVGKVYLTGSPGAPPYSVSAAELDMTESAVRVAVHRLRGRYRELLKQEVTQTIESPETVEEELRHLRAAIRGE